MACRRGGMGADCGGVRAYLRTVVSRSACRAGRIFGTAGVRRIEAKLSALLAAGSICGAADRHSLYGAADVFGLYGFWRRHVFGGCKFAAAFPCLFDPGAKCRVNDRRIAEALPK